jgi:glycosyltransferase involved in cell wall biosynthesis
MNPIVSVLIPVYNTAAYIERCANSLFRQTFENIEYIFVDDATPDNSMEILQTVMEQYPKAKQRTKILHHVKNQGLAKTRQTALGTAKGRYISIVDSDDYIEPEMIERLYKEICKENASIAVCDLQYEYYGYSKYVPDVIPANRNDYFAEILKAEQTQAFLCNKLVKRELYLQEDCKAPTGLNYLEDRHVMTRLYFYAKKIAKVNQPLYHYVHYNSRSLTKSKHRMHCENWLLFWQLMDDFLAEKQLNKTYQPITEYSKIVGKVRLLCDVRSSVLRREYAGLFRDFEMKYIKRFKFGERLMLWFIHYRFFFLAHTLYWYTRCKQKVFS